MYYNFTIIILLITVELTTAQQPDKNVDDFNYVDCGCKGSLDLKIFNGLSDAGNEGNWGGQEIADSDEESKGAVTIVNINDTDGDGDTNGDQKVDVTDINDPNGVFVNSSGRNELDLMKLIIDPIGEFTENCEVRIEYQGSIKFYSDYTKSTAITNLNFSLNVDPQTNLADDIILFIEVTSVSLNLRDIIIELYLDNNLIDKVTATGIWVELQEVYIDRANSTPPASVGIDLQPNEKLLNTIDNYAIGGYGVSGRRALDYSRYGFGTSGKLQNWNSIYVDGYLGGRILFQFDIKPHAIVPEMNNLGIEIDITRRKMPNNSSYDWGYYTTQNIVMNFPNQNELANDDDQLGPPYGPDDELDEDKTPISSDPNNTRIFSYDAPGQNRILLGGINPSPFTYYNTKFEEFVRLSLKNPINGNIVGGSRCSDKVHWELDYAAYSSTTTNSNKPYDREYFEMDFATPGSVVVSPISCTSTISGYQGNGNITIFNNISTYRPYILRFISDKWELYLVDVNDTLMLHDVSNISSSGPWLIDNTSDITIEIEQGTSPFVANDVFAFFIFTVNSSVTNSIKIN